ncbi:alpha/beta fold hydrolase [Corynebacterium tapiri]|uniref:Alpha/beta hydrolase n=1 Tax=Corynebacterium tapiri TaxID=1448266 RepID=A0A5C4U5X7_9CORY|nr:alpha/beta hydrolase [Corynebacterium tapiri]TNL98753.1 alpha/beta hydrolase [Corynebacterium tapiri]
MKPRSPLLRAIEVPLRTVPFARRLLAIGHGDEYRERREDKLVHARRGFVDSHGRKIAYYEYGPEDAELTVVFVHGFTLAAEAFYLQVDYLLRHFPQVKLVLLDLRGHGDSENVSISECTIDKAADDAICVIEERVPRGRYIILGHSLGGPVSLNVVRRAPEDVRVRLAGLVEVSTSVEELAQAGLTRVLNTWPVRATVEHLATKPESVLALRDRISGYLPHIIGAFFFMRDTHDELIEFHASLIAHAPPETLLGFVDDLRLHRELEAAQYLQDVPGYIISGEKDMVTPVSQARRLAEVWPKGYLQIAQGAGHMLPLEVPEIVNVAMERLLNSLGYERVA